MKRVSVDRRSRRSFWFLVAVLVVLTIVNYGFYLEMNRHAPPPTQHPATPAPVTVVTPLQQAPPTQLTVVIETAAGHTSPPAPTIVHATPMPGDEALGAIPDDSTDPPDPEINRFSYENALALFDKNQNVSLPKEQDPKQPTNGYYDVNELPDHGVVLPHDPHKATAHLHVHCDPSNTSFSLERDRLCQAYLSNLHNMRSIKAMSSILDTGRTIKFKVYYHNGNLSGIVKVSQNKFFFESASEYLAYLVDRVLHLHHVPPTAYVPLPLDYMRAAAGVVSPFYSQWFNLFIPNYDYTRENFVECDGDRGRKCSLTAIQLWMFDVHSTVMSNLRLPHHKLDDRVVEKYYIPQSGHHWPPQPRRHFSISELCDRFIFDFLIGNTDRGMNDHNNFVYGGCDKSTSCKPRPRALRTRYPAKYAFIDHGSSFHSHKEPEGNAFTGNATKMCRFRRSTYQTLKKFARKSGTDPHARPFIEAIKPLLPKGVFNVVRKSIFKKMQDRIDKLVEQADACIGKFGEDDVLSLLEENPDGVFED